jgi:DNA-binding beta-propeller fold protein YncE
VTRRLAICIAPVLFCCPLAANGTIAFRYESTLQLDVGAAGQVRPIALSVDPATGDVCVTDERGVSFHVVDGNGITLFTSSVAAALSTPVDGCLDRDGGFVFADRDAAGERTLRKLDLRGEPVRFDVEMPSPQWQPDHLLITADGNYVSLDKFAGTLTKHDAATGRVLWHRTLEGVSEQSELGRPAEAPDGRLFIPGGELHVVLVRTADGADAGSFGRPGTSPGRLAFPVGVAFGPADEVLVLDRMRHTVLVYDRDCNFTSEFGSFGGAPGQLYHPLAIAAAPGRVFVAQGYEGRVQAFGIFGTEAGE